MSVSLFFLTSKKSLEWTRINYKYCFIMTSFHVYPSDLGYSATDDSLPTQAFSMWMSGNYIHNYTRHSKQSANLFLACLWVVLWGKACVFSITPYLNMELSGRYKHVWDLTQKLYLETHSQVRFFFGHYCVWWSIER